MTYTQLTQEQRYQIYALLKIGQLNGNSIYDWDPYIDRKSGAVSKHRIARLPAQASAFAALDRRNHGRMHFERRSVR
jgi:hypothetical protein